MSDIVNLKPEAVWRFFDEITRIPRPSKKEEKIVAYLIDLPKAARWSTARIRRGTS